VSSALPGRRRSATGFVDEREFGFDHESVPREERREDAELRHIDGREGSLLPPMSMRWNETPA
jgi:hypothetical protein